MSLFSDLDQHKRLFALALPMILSNITVPLLGLVDTAVIGHLPHAYFLGGSTIGAMVISVTVWLFGFLRMSTTGLSAQALGRGDLSNNLTVLMRGLAIAMLIGLSIVLLQSPYINLSLSLAGGSAEIQFYASQYAHIRIWGVPAAMANLVILGWLIGNQQGKTVLWLVILTNLINIVLDILFVFAFDWQVQGIALASLLAEYSAMVIGLLLVFKRYKVNLMRLIADFTELKTSLFERHTLLHYFQLNRDILIRTLCLQICFLFITFMGARLGDNVVAANAILMNFLLLISFGLDGIANAAEAMVGKAYGEKKAEKLNSIVHVALFWSVIFALCYSLLFAIAGESLLGFITNIDSIKDFAKDYLLWMVLLPLVSCWCYLFDGVYIGLLQAKVMRNSMIISTFFCFFPVWFILKGFGNHGLWAAFSFFMLARGITLAWHFRYHVNVSDN